MIYVYSFKQSVESFDINQSLNGIDVVYWINLDRSKDRKDWMEQLFQEPVFQNLPNKRINAVDGKKPGVIDSMLDIPGKQDGHTDVVYACLLSHLNAIKELALSKYDLALIVEDDVCLDFQKYWKKSMREVITNAPPDWDIIQLYYWIDDKFLSDDYTLNADKKYNYTAVAYLINKSAAKKLINKIYKNDKYTLNMDYPHSADNYIYFELKSYVYKYPYFVHKTENDSTLHQEHVDEIHTPAKNRAIQAFEREIIMN
jgi:GR25 family glycosyltransferase involved in LPS biosynthesis